MIRWSVQIAENWTLIEFFTEGLLDRRKLNEIRLPDELSQRTDMGLIISGPGPIWLYAYLAHLAHHFAWVATYEPRLRGAVIVQSHITGGPVPGDIIPMADKSVPHDSPVSAGKASKRRGCDATYIISSVQDSRSWSDRLGMALFVVFALIALTAGSLLTGAGWSILHDIQWPKVEQVTVPLPANPVTIDSPAPPAVAQDHDHAMTNSLSAVGWAVWLVAIFLFFRLAFWLYRRRFYTHRHLSAYSMILVGIILLIAGHIVVLGVHDMLTVNTPWTFGALLALLPICVWQAHRFRRVLTGVSSLSTKSFSSISQPAFMDIPQIKHLILPISAPDWRPDWQRAHVASEAPSQEEQAVFYPDSNPQFRSDVTTIPGPVWLFGQDISEDINLLGKLGRPKWQHMLRALQPHRSTLDTVWLIGSSGAADSLQPKELDHVVPKGRMSQDTDRLGSFAFLDDAARLIRPYLGTDCKIVRCDPVAGQVLGFEDVEKLQRVMLRIVTHIQKEHKVSADEIVIDATGGLKTTSIVGAVSTLNNESLFQYVDTRPPHDVILFDQRLDVPPDVHGV